MVINRIRLKGFLDSNCLKLPVDWKYFQRGGSRESLCLFCKRPHDDLEVFTVHYDDSLDKQYERDTDCFSCNSCYLEIRNKTKKLTNINTLFANREKRLDRVEHYLNDCAWSPSVHEYFQETSDFVSKSNQCYFCDNTTGALTFFQVPVQNTLTFVTGGSIRVCPSCLDFLRDKGHRNHREHMAHFDHTKETCPECSMPYYITEMEKFYRKREMSAFICPACALDKFRHERHTGALSKLTKALRRVDSKSILVSRLLHESCFFCKADLDFDFYLSDEELAKQCFKDKIVCPGCVLNEHPPTISVSLPGKVLLVYEAESGKWIFVLKSISGKTLFTQVSNKEPQVVLFNILSEHMKEPQTLF